MKQSSRPVRARFLARNRAPFPSRAKNPPALKNLAFRRIASSKPISVFPQAPAAVANFPDDLVALVTMRRTVSLAVELLRKASLRSSKIDKRNRPCRIWRRPPIFFLRRISDQAQTLANLFPLRGSKVKIGNARASTASFAWCVELQSGTPCSGWQVVSTLITAGPG